MCRPNFNLKSNQCRLLNCVCGGGGGGGNNEDHFFFRPQVFLSFRGPGREKGETASGPEHTGGSPILKSGAPSLQEALGPDPARPPPPLSRCSHFS